MDNTTTEEDVDLSAECDCGQAVAEAEVSDEGFDLSDFAAVLGLSDNDLEAPPEDVLGVMSLESFLAPGGGWGGSQTPVNRALAIGQSNGLQQTSRKRTSGNTGSDHHTSQRLSDATDLSNGTRPTPQMLRTAQQIAAAMGYRWPSSGYLQTSTTSRGYRAQLIYNAPSVPGHHNHVHFGVRKVR